MLQARPDGVNTIFLAETKKVIKPQVAAFGESRQFASYGSNRGVNNMDCCFHVFISVSFVAVHRRTVRNLVRGYAEMWKQPRITRISRMT